MVKRIAVDIGNSTIACALFEDGEVITKWYHGVKETSDAALSIGGKHREHGITTVAISTVVPSAREDLVTRLKQAEIPTTEITLQEQRAINDFYPTLGLDRLANCAAMKKLYVKDIADAGIIMDFGTATTLTAVSSSGSFLGGMITLGLKETLKALYSNTEQLPLLEVENVFQNQFNPLATTTTEAILNGAILAHVGFVQRWIAEAKREIKGKTVVVATGGLSHFLSDALAETIDYFDSNLTLKGINLIAAEVMDPTDRG